MSTSVRRSNSSPSAVLRYRWHNNPCHECQYDSDQYSSHRQTIRASYQTRRAQRSSFMSSGRYTERLYQQTYGNQCCFDDCCTDSLKHLNTSSSYFPSCSPSNLSNNYCSTRSFLMQWIIYFLHLIANYFHINSYWTNYYFNFNRSDDRDLLRNSSGSAFEPHPIQYPNNYCCCGRCSGESSQAIKNNQQQYQSFGNYHSNQLENTITTGNLLRSATLSSFVAPPSPVVDCGQPQPHPSEQIRPRSVSLDCQNHHHLHHHQNGVHPNCPQQQQQSELFNALNLPNPSILNVFIKPLFNAILDWTYVNTFLNTVHNMRQKMRNLFRWCPTSPQELEEAEAKVLSYLKCNYQGYYVDIGNGWDLEHVKIWTLEVDPEPIYANEPKETMMGSKPDLLHHEPSPSVTETPHGLPLVMIHGFAAGVGLWALNLDELAKRSNRKIYAFDLLGFARSSRPNFPPPNLKKMTQPQRIKAEAEQMEEYFVQSIEEWRKTIGGPLNDKFILMGHSFGAYLSLAYALRHPSHVAHLVLADAWGVASEIQSRAASMSGGHINTRQLPWWAKLAGRLFLDLFNPLSALRAVGPWGPSLVQGIRPDIRRKFERLTNNGQPTEMLSAAIKAEHPPPLDSGDSDDDDDDDDDNDNDLNLAGNAETDGPNQSNNNVSFFHKPHAPKKSDAPVEKCDFLEYIYHCNAQKMPSGEMAFKRLCTSTGWARLPFLERIHELDPKITLTFIYGSRSWIDRQTGLQAKLILATKASGRLTDRLNNNINNNNSSDELDTDEELEERVEIHVIPGAGHHVYADKPDEFNELLINISSRVDSAHGLDLIPSINGQESKHVDANHDDDNDDDDDDGNNQQANASSAAHLAKVDEQPQPPPPPPPQQQRIDGDSAAVDDGPSSTTRSMANRPERKYGNYMRPPQFDGANITETHQP